MENCIAEFNHVYRARIIDLKRLDYLKQQRLSSFDNLKNKTAAKGVNVLSNLYVKEICSKIMMIGDMNQGKERIDFFKFYEKYKILSDIAYEVNDSVDHIKIPVDPCPLEATLKQIALIYSKLKRPASYTTLLKDSKKLGTIINSPKEKPHLTKFSENKFFIHKVLHDGIEMRNDENCINTNDIRKSSRSFKPSRIVRDILEDITFEDNLKKPTKCNNIPHEDRTSTDTLDQSFNTNGHIPTLNGYHKCNDTIKINATSSKQPNSQFLKGRLKMLDGTYNCPYKPCIFQSTFISSLLRHITFKHKDQAAIIPQDAEIGQYCQRHPSGYFVCTLPDCYFVSSIKIRVMRHLTEFHNGAARKTKNSITLNGESPPTPHNHKVLDEGKVDNDNCQPVDETRGQFDPKQPRKVRRKMGPRVKYVSRRRETVYPLARFPNPSEGSQGSPLCALPPEEKERLFNEWTAQNDLLELDETPTYHTHNGHNNHHNEGGGGKAKYFSTSDWTRPSTNHAHSSSRLSSTPVAHNHVIKVRSRRYFGGAARLRANRDAINKIFAPLLDLVGSKELAPLEQLSYILPEVISSKNEETMEQPSLKCPVMSQPLRRPSLKLTKINGVSLPNTDVEKWRTSNKHSELPVPNGNKPSLQLGQEHASGLLSQFISKRNCADALQAFCNSSNPGRQNFCIGVQIDGADERQVEECLEDLISKL